MPSALYRVAMVEPLIVSSVVMGSILVAFAATRGVLGLVLQLMAVDNPRSTIIRAAQTLRKTR